MINWSTTALIFPGQGSQQVGMAHALANHYPAAADVLRQADSLLGMAFSTLMANGPAETLDLTYNTQPALYIAGIAAYRALEAVFGSPMPVGVAGHSLGEFTALTAAGALAFEDGLRLVRERGRLMQEAGEKKPGAMAALLGIELAAAYEVCTQASQQTGQPVVVANDNCPGQIVISGNTAAVEAALPLAKERGAKRAVKLAVSVAAHSPLMASAADEFRALLMDIPFTTPFTPVIGNLSAAPLHTPDDIRTELAAQLTGAVRWTDSILALRKLGATTFIELGSKDVLTGMLKRIDRDVNGTAVYTKETLDLLV